MANDYLPTLDGNYRFSPEVAAQIAGDAFLPAPHTANIAGAHEVDVSHPVQRLTVTGDAVITMPAAPAGRTTPITLILVQDGTGHTVTMPTAVDTVPVRWAMGVAPTPTDDAAARSVYYLVGYDGDGWDAFVSGQDMS